MAVINTSEDALASAERSFKALISKSSRPTVSNLEITQYSGWLSKSSGYRLDRKHLEKINPGFKVKISRVWRRELLRNFRTHGLFPGFSIAFTPVVGSAENLLPALVAQNARGEKVAPTGSTNVMRLFVDDLKPGLEDELLNSAESQLFYLDRKWLKARHRNEFENNWIFKNMDLLTEVLRHFPNKESARWVLARLPKSRIIFDGLSKISFLSEGLAAECEAPYMPFQINRNYSQIGKIPRQEFVTAELHKDEVRFKEVQRTIGITNPEFNSLENVLVWNGCQVLRGNTFFLIENAADPIREFVSGQWEYAYGGPAEPDAVLLFYQQAPEISVASGILIGGRNETNWYHWVIEYVSRIVNMESIPIEVPLLISDKVPEHFLDVIKSISTREIVRLPIENHWRVSRLYFAQPSLQIFDSGDVGWSDSLVVNRETLLKFRSKVLGTLNETTDAGKVFLVRNSAHRDVTNQDKLTAVARELGYQIIDPASLNWRQQLELFAGASIIVGASGAVMANFLFVNRGARILGLTSSVLWDFVLPSYIANVAGASFSYLLGDSKVGFKRTHPNDQVHSDFKIQPRKFRKALEKL